MRALLILTVALAAVSPGPPRTSLPAPERAPVLVELFTSEGCSSCPPADVLLAKLQREQPVAGAEIVAMSLHVDYWDHQGWKDPFSSKTFTARQQSYARVFGEDRVYTPQMVVDGRDEFTGSDEAKALRVVGEASSRPRLPLTLDARAAAGSVKISIDLPAAPAGAEPIDVIVALTEDGLTSVVRRGENGGRTLSHAAVARRLQTLGALEKDSFVASGQLDLQAAWKPERMRAVVFLQGRTSRHVYGAAAAALSR
ncbi:MAG TPA: DUF1223 domain-containing protein [Vicinamibacterales bacterium]|nr:DUF1223 domain-containing protein [Vicinamibacterales bacterium]